MRASPPPLADHECGRPTQRLSSLDRMLDEQQGRATTFRAWVCSRWSMRSSPRPALRRAVTDPGTPEGARRALVHGLLDGKVDKAVVNLVAEAATLRWAGGRTFAAALERQAVRGQLITLPTAMVIWRTPRTNSSGSRDWWSPVPDCATRLADRSIDLERRQELVGDLLEGRATDRNESRWPSAP